MNFQGANQTVFGMAQQKKILGLLLEDKKVFVEKTPNQKRMIDLARILDEGYEI